MSFFRFRRRARIFPGLWLNLSKSGVTVSAGVRGLTFNSSGRTTISAPGTGLSYVSTLTQGRRHPVAWIVVALVVVYLLAALGRSST